MNPRFQNAVQAQALLASQPRATDKVGIVTAYDPPTYAIRVKLQPEDVETGWIPIKSIWVGNGWGLFAPPSLGDLVSVSFNENEPGSGLYELSLFNNVDQPLPVPSGEFWLVHKLGTLIQVLNNGDLQVTTQRDLLATVGRNVVATVAGNLTANVTGNANLAITGNITSNAAQWNHTGPIAITGTLNVSALITGMGGITVSGGTGYTAQFNGNVYGVGTITTTGDGNFTGTSVHTHTHSDPQGGSTGVPL